jgi:hypothetical protein
MHKNDIWMVTHVLPFLIDDGSARGFETASHPSWKWTDWLTGSRHPKAAHDSPQKTMSLRAPKTHLRVGNPHAPHDRPLKG